MTYLVLKSLIEMHWNTELGGIVRLSLNGSNNKLPKLFPSYSIELEDIQLKKRKKKKKSNRFYGGWTLSMKTYQYFLKAFSNRWLVEDGVSKYLEYQISFTQVLKYEHQDPTSN